MGKEELIVSPDEAKAEEEQLAEVKEEELREKVISDLGLTDDDENSDLINKLVTREKGQREMLSGAIKQKIAWRTKATDPAHTVSEKKTETAKKEETPAFDPEEIRKQTEATVRAQFDNQYLEDLEYPDDIKDEIRKVAKANETTVREASKDPYITYKLEQAVQEKRLDEAAVRGTKKSVATEASGEKFLNPSDFDLNTEEGRKAWKEAKAKRNK